MRTFLLLLLAFILAACSRTELDSHEETPAYEPGKAPIEMGLEAQEHVGLRVEPAAVSRLQEYLQVTGTIQAIDSRIGHIRPLARGRVQEVLVSVGERVQSGQPLARFDNVEAGELASQYQAAQAELQRLKVQHAAATRQMERSRRLLEIGAVSQKEFEISQAEQQSLQETVKAQESVIGGLAARLQRFGANPTSADSSITTILSPFAGVVTRVQVAPGAVVDAESELFQVADLSQLWVQAEVYEKDLARVRVGQPAFVQVETYPEERFTARVTYIADALDPATRTAKVRCEVPNPGTRLKLDMFATVSVPTTFSQEAIAVPMGAVQQVEGRNVVFVRKAETKFEARQVQTGREVNGRTEIVSGLSEGEPVVVAGAFHLKSILLGGELGEKE